MKNLYLNQDGKEWEIEYTDGAIVCSDNGKNSCSSHKIALQTATQLIKDKKSQGFLHSGNVYAENTGTKDSVPSAVISKVEKIMGPRPSIHSDYEELLMDILKNPCGYTGGTLFFNGSTTIDGNFDASDFAAIVVDGDLTINGLLNQYELEPFFVVLGNMTVGSMIFGGNLEVTNSLNVKGVGGFSSNNKGCVFVGGDIIADTLVINETPVQAQNVRVRHLNIDADDSIKSNNLQVNHQLPFSFFSLEDIDVMETMLCLDIPID